MRVKVSIDGLTKGNVRGFLLKHVVIYEMIRFVRRETFPASKWARVAPETSLEWFSFSCIPTDTNKMVIGITGHARAGKDTVADYLVDCYGFRKIAFADRLKQVCQIVFGFTKEDVYEHQNGTNKDTWMERIGTTPRHVLPYVGTDLFRNEIEKMFPKIGKNVWIEGVKRTMESNTSIPHWILSDVRFQNEVEWIREQGGMVIRIVRSNKKRQDTHVSETEWEQIKTDVVLTNEGSIDRLYEQVNDVMKTHGYPKPKTCNYAAPPT